LRYEPILFFDELLKSGGSLLDLLDSDWTVGSKELLKHYGLPADIEGLRENPVRVPLPPGSHRGGLLGMASILAVSSLPNRTSPVLRGKWALENLLGLPPPPPPPDVPKLEENHAGDAPKTTRARLEQHRANPACASCHDRIDPIGFGLENYDVLGRWRTEDSGQPIDAGGRLPDGSQFNGPEELKAVLFEKKDLIIRNLVEKLLGYALGRGLSLEDSCAVDQILDHLREREYNAHTLILEIIRSKPFRYAAPRGVEPAAIRQGREHTRPDRAEQSIAPGVSPGKAAPPAPQNPRVPPGAANWVAPFRGSRALAPSRSNN
jgi:hypothetical protein